MILKTRHFGELEIDEKNMITFEEGLLGFKGINHYIMIENPDPEVPFHWLQAIEEPELAFVITSPFLFKADYEFDIPQSVTQQLDIDRKEDVMVYSITVIPEDIKEMRINLNAPVIINLEKKKGKQMILESDEYPIKYYLFQNTEETNIG